MITALLILNFIIGLSLIGLVLIQHGKGADAGSGFGGGVSGGVMDSVSPANFLTKITAWLAAAFFVVSLSLTWFYQKELTGGDDLITVDDIDLIGLNQTIDGESSEQNPLLPE